MLEVQYRMHPAIGALVGRLFYGGRLVHAPIARATDAIAARAPFPGAPVVVVDTAARTTCERSAKGSVADQPGLRRDHRRPRARGGARRRDVDRA